MSERTVPLRNGVKRFLLSLPMLSILAGCGDETQTGGAQPPSSSTPVAPGAATTPGNQPLRGFLDVPSGRREVSYEVVDGVAIHDGDIILGNADEVAAQWQAARTGAAAPQPGARVPYGNQIPPGGSFGSTPWPNGVVKYKYEPGSFTVTQRLLIFSAMIVWMPAGIQFQECTTASPCSYYVYIQKKTLANSGCGQSRIGKSPNLDNASYQNLFLNIANSSCANDLTAVAVHEIGHAIGLYHEHQRADRNKYVKIGSGAAIDYGADGNFGTGDDPVTHSPLISTGRYDFESVMHYKSGNLGKTITLADGRALPPFTGLGRSVNGANPDGKTPSVGDQAAAASLYQNVDVTDVEAIPGYLFQNQQGAFKNFMNNTPPQAASMALAGTHYTTSYLARRSPSSTLVVRKYSPNSGWGQWQEMPGLIIGSGVGIGVNYQTGGFYAAALSEDRSSVCVHNGSTWNCDLGGPWPSADGYSLDRFTAPVVATNPFGDLWVGALAYDPNGLNGTLMTTVRFADGSWTGWYPFLTDVYGTPSIVWTPWGTDVFYVSRSDGGVHDSFGLFPAGSKPPGVTLDAGLSVVTRHVGTDPWADQTFDVFVRGSDNMIWSRSRHNSTWDSAWKMLGGPAYTVPAAITFHDDLRVLPIDLYFGGPFGAFLTNTTFYDPKGLNNVTWHKRVAP